MAPQPAEWKSYCRDLDHVILGNRATLLNDGRDAYPAMLEAIRTATKRVLLESYIFDEDHIGNRFRAALEERARAGVPVVVVHDGAGTVSTSKAFFQTMEKAGVQVRVFHPLAPWKPHWNWFRRDHRKLLIADDAAFVGGMNISDESVPLEEGGKGWRDVSVRMEGPVVHELAQLFWSMWTHLHGTVPEGLEEVPSPPAGDLPVRVLTSAGLKNRHSIRRSYLNAIDQARESICISNAYFLPGRSIYRRLIKAAERGVKVRILLPYQTDHPYVRWAGRALFRVFLENGVELYEYQKSVLHSKTAVIDGIWSTVGSHNLDHRSLFFNLELNLTVYGRPFGEQMEAAFEKDLKDSLKMDLKTWRERPLFRKLSEELLYQFRYLL